jgi:hypothetical protein
LPPAFMIATSLILFKKLLLQIKIYRLIRSCFNY